MDPLPDLDDGASPASMVDRPAPPDLDAGVPTPAPPGVYPAAAHAQVVDPPSQSLPSPLRGFGPVEPPQAPEPPHAPERTALDFSVPGLAPVAALVASNAAEHPVVPLAALGVSEAPLAHPRPRRRASGSQEALRVARERAASVAPLAVEARIALAGLGDPGLASKDDMARLRAMEALDEIGGLRLPVVDGGVVSELGEAVGELRRLLGLADGERVESIEVASTPMGELDPF